MNNSKRVFLLTSRERKPYHMQNLKARYKEQITFVDTLDDAEIVLCIGNGFQNVSWEMQKAQEMGLRLSYFNEELLPEKEIQRVLAREIECQKTKVDEIAFSGEEL